MSHERNSRYSRPQNDLHIFVPDQKN
jgi:hypothetical protein